MAQMFKKFKTSIKAFNRHQQTLGKKFQKPLENGDPFRILNVKNLARGK